MWLWDEEEKDMLDLCFIYYSDGKLIIDFVDCFEECNKC